MSVGRATNQRHWATVISQHLLARFHEGFCWFSCKEWLVSWYYNHNKWCRLKPPMFVWLLSVCLYKCIQFTFKTVFVYHICSDEDWRERSDSVQAPDEGESLEMGPGQCQAGVQERQTRLHHRHPEASFVCFYLFLLCLNQQNVTVGQNAKLYGELWSFPVCFRPNSKTLNTLHDQY